MNKKEKRERAEKWFAAHGINPNTPDSDGNQRVLDMRPAQSFTEDMGWCYQSPLYNYCRRIFILCTRNCGV